MMHFFEVRFNVHEHEMIDVASKCMDLRLFYRPTLPGGQSLDNCLHKVVQPQYKNGLEWAQNVGINVESWEDSFSSLEVLAMRLHKEVTDFYEGAASSTARHKWDDVCGRISVSGVDIQRRVMTKRKWYDGASAFLFIYMMVVLRIANEAVVEGMCGCVDKHAIGQRGLRFEMYACESIVHFNMHAQSHSDSFIVASSQKYNEMFLHGTPLRSYSTDK
jgi:hypothetical protein